MSRVMFRVMFKVKSTGIVSSLTVPASNDWLSAMAPDRAHGLWLSTIPMIAYPNRSMFGSAMQFWMVSLGIVLLPDVLHPKGKRSQRPHTAQ